MTFLDWSLVVAAVGGLWVAASVYVAVALAIHLNRITLNQSRHDREIGEILDYLHEVERDKKNSADAYWRLVHRRVNHSVKTTRHHAG